ncbi:hypothetical protein AVEN_121727-1 [Araneus ventricosus]|uniref:Uncharacterized protein n=1 Tax=Araneus ventricosus TaxID=182803 RepID=A0A4Y2CB40_ARAVE|nr:hypothetical protein AVEN_121727-1 [Araneus ventricosus]
MKIGIAEWQCWNSKSNTSCVDSNLGPRLEGSGTSKALSTLKSRVEGRNETRNLPRRGRGGWVSEWVEFCDFEPCLKTNFGASVNDVPHFSMDGKKGLGTNGMEWSADECPAYHLSMENSSFQHE